MDPKKRRRKGTKSEQGENKENQNKNQNKKTKETWICVCPVCQGVVTNNSFTCTHCKPKPQWVHIKCGGYKYADVRKAEPGSLRCKNCKEVTFCSLSGVQYLPVLLHVLGWEWC